MDKKTPKNHSSSHDEWVKIGYLQDADAELVASLFESQGIPALIQGRNHRRMLGFIGGYIELRLLVPAAQEEEGQALLNDYFSRRNEEFTTDSEMIEKERTRLLLFSRTSQRLGIALLLSAFLGFGLASLSAGAWWIGIPLGIIQLLTYFPEVFATLSQAVNISPELAKPIQLWIPVIDLSVSWIYLISRAIMQRSQENSRRAPEEKRSPEE